MFSDNLRHASWILIAFMAGMLGSLAGGKLSVQAAPAESVRSIRSTRFELVDSADRIRAALDLGPGEQPRLRLYNEHSATVVTLAISSGGSPNLVMNGRDGRPRVALRLSSDGKPTLTFGDAQWEERVVLGVVQRDSADASADSWALLFGNPVSRQFLAGVGMNTPKDHEHDVGSISIRDRVGRRWDAGIAGDPGAKRP